MTVRVFVVEDEKAFIDVYKKIFNLIDFEIGEWAFSGEEAIEKFKVMKPAPDIIIMDHRLPRMNGVETMVELLKIDPSARILFVSADERSEALARANGAIDFIQKPFSLASFISTITKCAGIESQFKG